MLANLSDTKHILSDKPKYFRCEDIGSNTYFILSYIGFRTTTQNGGIYLDNIEKEPQAKTDNRNYNKIRVNNHINFTVNFGDSLNLLALIAGVFFIKTVSKKTKQKSPKRKKALILS